MMKLPTDLVDAVNAVWRLPVDTRQLQEAPEFRSLVKICSALYPLTAHGFALDWTIQQTLQRLGLEERTAGPAPQAIAAALDRAFAAVGATRHHYCPLDGGGEFPPLAFGPNQIKRFSEDELKQVVASFPVGSHFNARFDAKRLAQIQWLVVEEPYTLSTPAPARAMPFFFSTWADKLGTIDPHKAQFPPTVEAALFFLMLAPWEDLVDESRVDWRAFRIPWIMTLDDDLLAPTIPAPDPDSLTWLPVYRQDEHGDVVEEIEAPDDASLVEGSSEVLAELNHRAWTRFRVAREGAMMVGPIEHFFVRAYVSDGIDEFLYHITTIEACLGQSGDHQRGLKPLPDKSNGATGRTAWRLSALLNDWTAGPSFRALFKERSQFVHGETMGAISNVSRRLARSLARRCVRALIEQAPAPGVAREEFLKLLVDRHPAQP
jgi:hypothetical protein